MKALMTLPACRKTFRPRRAVAHPAILFLLLSAVSAPISRASTIMFATGPITLGAGDSDNAEADITMNAGAHTLTVTLLNLQRNPLGIASAIGGVEIDFANLSGNAAATLASTTATTFNIDASGSITGMANVSSTNWLVEDAADPLHGAGYTTNTVALCVVCMNTTGASPTNDLVIGAPATNQPAPYGYSASDSSIAGHHNPYIVGSGSTFTYGTGTPLAGADTTPTWVLNLPQLQANTTITKVRFYFGSRYIIPGKEADAAVEFTPEPGPIPLVIGGLLLIVLSAWRRRATAAAVIEEPNRRQ